MKLAGKKKKTTDKKSEKETEEKSVEQSDAKEEAAETSDDALDAVIEQAAPQILPMMMMGMSDMMGPPEPKPRFISLYGDVDEKNSHEALMSLIVLNNNAAEEQLEDPEDPESKIIIVKKPIKMYISTFGGSALDMFSVYDGVRMCIADGVPVHTHGFGKIMSAGVLLLACGSKGERRIGKHTRVMIHGVISGQSGHIHDIENEMEETKFTQLQYHKALAQETNMTQSYLKKLVARKTNVYFTAQEAVELGIADIII